MKSLFYKIIIFLFIFFLNVISVNAEDNGSLGVQVSKYNQYVHINYVYKNSVAYKSGIRDNDFISHIDGFDISSLSLEESIKLLKGEVGSSVELKIITFDFTPKTIILKREPFVVPDIVTAVNHANSGNVSLAYDMLLKLANQNDPEAQHMLGQINKSEQYQINNYEESFYWTKLSADQNYLFALYDLGLMYSFGIGTEKNLIKAHEYYLKAAKLKMPDAYYQLSYIYTFGEGVKKNIQEAIKWNLQLIEYSNVQVELDKYYDHEAYSNLYYIYMWEEKYKDHFQAFDYVSKLVNERGTGSDYYNLAYMYEVGAGTKQNYTKAFELYLVAEEKGDLSSKQSIANLYYNGDGVKQNYEKAFERYIYLDKRDDFELSDYVYRYLGDYYRYGYGEIEVDQNKALQYYFRSYNDGDNPYAAKSIGEIYYEEFGDDKSIQESIKWFEIALNNEFSSALAAEYLGKIYEYGEGGIKRDLKQAFTYYKIAGDDNYSNGSFAVARFFEEGLHGIIDYEKAAYWYQKSAEEGYSTGALKLAELYNSGKLGENKSKDAQYWYQYSLDASKDSPIGMDMISAKKIGIDLILGNNVEKNVELGLSYLLENAFNDPSSIVEIANLSKNKIISKKQAKEFFDKIEAQAKFDNITKVSLALIYYFEALYVDKDIDKYIKILEEVIDSPYIVDDIHHAYAYSFLSSHYAESDFNKAEKLLREGLFDISNNYINEQTLEWSIDLLITSLTDIYNYNGEIYKVEKIVKQLLGDKNNDSISYLSKTMLSCTLINSLESQYKYNEALLYFDNCYKFTEDLNDANMMHYNFNLIEIILLTKTDQLGLAQSKYAKLEKKLETFYSNPAIIEPSIILALDGSANFYLGNIKKSLAIFEVLESKIVGNELEVYDNTLIYAVDYIKILKSTGNLEKALSIAQQLISQRLDNSSLQSIIQKKNILYRFHEIYLDLLFEVKGNSYVEESFIVSQITKNSEISEYLKNSIITLSAENSQLEKFVTQKKKIELEISNLAKSDYSNSDLSEEKILLQKNKIWKKLNKKLDSTNNKISSQFPEYFELLKPKIYNIKTVQEKLNDNDIIISTFTGRENLYIWSISKDHITFDKIDITFDDLKSLVSEIRQTLDQSDIVNASQLKPFDFDLSNELYKMLFQNINNDLTNFNSIFFVLDSSLQSLPLEILITDTNNKNYQNASWLINDYEISYLTSLDDLISSRENNTTIINNNISNNFIAFADPLLDNQNSEIRSSIKIDKLFDNRGSVSLEDLSQLPSLPETADEVLTIADILEGDIEDLYLQSDANEINVKDINLANTKVISFATHGLVNGEIKGLTEPALVLTPPDNISDKNDGLLKSSEIALLDLNAEIVILSACNTAASDGTPGAEGLSGLAKSFFIAGSKSVLVSHWPVFSESTKDTMINLFESGKDKKISYSKSLQKAKLEIIKNNKYDIFSHPTFWAPFIIVGIN